MLQVAAEATPRQVAAFLLPGDVLRGSAVPPHAEASLISANAAELWRFRWSAMEDFAAANRGLVRFLQDAAAARLARDALHTAVLGQFSSEQRVATVLTELAMLTGTPSPAGAIVIDMPFRRNDLADYLGEFSGIRHGAGRWCATSALLRGSRRRHARLPKSTSIGVATG